MHDARHDARHDWRSDVRARLAAANLDPADEAEMVDEIGEHLEEQYAELAAKIGAGAAREQLLAQLRDERFEDAIHGKRRRAKPSKARVWTATTLLRDVRYGMRSLRRSPATLVAGTTALALGIGLTTMMFSIIYGLLMKGLPYEDPERIAIVKYVDPTQPGVDALVSLADFSRFRERQKSFESLGAYYGSQVNVTGGDRPDRVSAARISTGVLEITRIRPLLGRLPGPADVAPDAAPTAVLSYELWRDRFASNPAVVGATIRVNGQPCTVIGVTTAKLGFPPFQLWLPIQTQTATLAPGEGPSVNMIGRLRPNVSYDQANAEFRALRQQLAVTLAAPDSNMRFIVLPFVRASTNPRVYSLLYAMLGAVLLVLLVACANVANLLLDRAANRTREIGIRTALGASRLAIVRLGLIEAVILALAAAALGTLVAQAGISLFNHRVAGATLPFWADISISRPVLAFVVVIAVAASVVSGLLPALQSARLDINAILKDESHSASSLRVGRLSRAIVVAELAVSSAILIAAGFITRSIVNLRAVEPGFATTTVFTGSVSPSTTDTVRRRLFFETLERELGAIPGAAGAALTTGLPGANWRGSRMMIEGKTYARPRDVPNVRTLSATAGFFRTFDVRISRGRGIQSTDRAGSEPVGVISEALARRFFRGDDPIGKRLRLGTDSTAPWLTVVGVMPTLFSYDFQDPYPPEVVTSFWQQRRSGSALLAVRTPNIASAAADVRKIVAAADPETPVFATETMADNLDRQMLVFHVFGTVFIVFGLAALLLAAIGLYAVMTFSVSRRTREMGIRLALGATAGDVIRMICRQSALQILGGMGIGFVIGAVLIRAARAALFQVQPNDPAVLVMVAAVLGTVGLVACLIPARRATRVDPVIALRTE